VIRKLLRADTGAGRHAAAHARSSSEALAESLALQSPHPLPWRKPPARPTPSSATCCRSITRKRSWITDNCDFPRWGQKPVLFFRRKAPPVSGCRSTSSPRKNLAAPFTVEGASRHAHHLLIPPALLPRDYAGLLAKIEDTLVALKLHDVVPRGGLRRRRPTTALPTVA